MLLRILYPLLLCLALPWVLYRLHWPKEGHIPIGKRWREHFGISVRSPQTVDVWIHAVSVGEVLASTPFIKALKQQHPEWEVLLTTTTASGAQQANNKLAELVTHRYAPLDFAWCVRIFLHQHQPRRLWIIETELWPNWLRLCQNKQVEVSLVNARLSARSQTRYARFGRQATVLLSRINRILAQHQDDAYRFTQLGYPSKQLQVTGSIKYDLAVDEQGISHARKERQALFAQRPVIIAASTHQGEDQEFIALAQRLRRDVPELLLVLVPRHPERFDAVAKLVSSPHLARRSLKQAVNEHTHVYLGDTMGELLQLYAMADVALMGGSFAAIGGHNYLEPAALALPCLSGPHDFNFSDVSLQLQHAGALLKVPDATALDAPVLQWLRDPSQRQQDGQAGKEVVTRNQGAIARSLAALS